MLSSRIDYASYDALALEQRPVDGTVFSIGMPLDKKFIDFNPPMPDTERPYYPIDENSKISPTSMDWNRQTFSRQIDIPSVLGLSLTDQTSRGIFESKAPRVNPSNVQAIFDKSQIIADQAPPLDATILNNSSVDGFQTVITQPQSPLGANFAGSSVVASGTDPAQFYSTTTTPLPPEDTAADDPNRPSDCGTFDFPCKFKAIKGEVTVIVVGLILLAVGIFALTR